MNTNLILEKTSELIDEIKSSDIYQSFLQYEKKVLNNQQVKELLHQFQKDKKAFEEAYRYKDYYPNYNEIVNQYQTSKITLMKSELFKSYKAFEKEVDLLLQEIEFKLKKLINIKEKHGNIYINIDR